MEKYISFEKICEHNNNIEHTELKLMPGNIYKGGNKGNHSDDVLSKLLQVGNTGGMRSKKTHDKKKVAYVVLNITHKNNRLPDSIDYDKKEVIYFGDNLKDEDIFKTKHKGNERLKYLYDNIDFPEKQFPLFLFERDEECMNRDFKYAGIVVPSREADGLVIFEDKVGGKQIPNYKAKLILTQDIVDFKWINDICRKGVVPIESEYCPLNWKEAILGIEQTPLDKIVANENWNQESIVESGVEGKQKLIYTTKYERDPKLRDAAIRIHGTKCEVCGFDFEMVYGELGKDFIEVHHIKPLSTQPGEQIINPKTDLVCLCSNCHSMIHRSKNKVITVDELKKIFKEHNN